MHPLIERNPELKKLYEFENYLTNEMLGKTGKEYKDLARLRGKVRKKIKSIDMWAPIREQMAQKQEAHSE